MKASIILSLPLAVFLRVALTARGDTDGRDSLVPAEPSETTSYTGGLLPSRRTTPISPRTAGKAWRSAICIKNMAIPECIRNLGAATKGIVKRGVDKLIPSTTTGRVLLSLGLLAVIAALTIVWTGVASQWVGGLAPAVPLTIERLQQVLPYELANYGLEIGAVEPMQSWTLKMKNPVATYICGSCFDHTTSILEVAEHCSRIYQNFQGNICPAMEVLDAEFF